MLRAHVKEARGEASVVLRLKIMSLDKYNLVHQDDEWKLEKHGQERAIKNFEKKEDAMEFSTDYVKNHTGSLRIHKENGEFQEERTYPRSADPRSSPG